MGVISAMNYSPGGIYVCKPSPSVNIEAQAYFYSIDVIIGALVVDGGLNIFRLVVV